jgi:hypothetical protein
MFRAFKRIAFAVSVPAALAVGGWAQWTTFTTDAATVGTPGVAGARVDVVRNSELPNASGADTRIKSALSPDRLARDGTVERAQPPVPAVRANTEFAQANAALDPRIKPAPSPDPRAGNGTTGRAEPPAVAAKASTEFVQANATLPDPPIEPSPAAERGFGEKLPSETTKAAPAEQQPSSSSTNRLATKETKERQAALPRKTQEYRPTREQEQESRRSQNEAADARKAIVAKRQKADQARQQWLPGPNGIGRREVQALITEFRKSRSIEDYAARLEAHGRAAW